MDLTTALTGLSQSDIEQINTLLASENAQKELRNSLNTSDPQEKARLERVLFVFASLKNEIAPKFLSLVHHKPEEDPSLSAPPSGTPSVNPINPTLPTGPAGSIFNPLGFGQPNANKPTTLQDGLSRYDEVFPSFQDLDDFVAEYNQVYGAYIPLPEIWVKRCMVEAMALGNDVYLEWQKQNFNIPFAEEDQDKRNAVLSGFVKNASIKGIELAIEYGFFTWDNAYAETELKVDDNEGAGESKTRNESIFDTIQNKTAVDKKARKIFLNTAEAISLINTEEMFHLVKNKPECINSMKDFAKFNLVSLAVDVLTTDSDETREMNNLLLEVIGISGGLNARDAVTHITMPSAFAYFLLNMRKDNAPFIMDIIRAHEQYQQTPIKEVFDDSGNDIYKMALMGLMNEHKTTEDLDAAIDAIILLLDSNKIELNTMKNSIGKDIKGVYHDVSKRRLQLFQNKVESLKAQPKYLINQIEEVEKRILVSKSAEEIEMLKEAKEKIKKHLESLKDVNLVYQTMSVSKKVALWKKIEEKYNLRLETLNQIPVSVQSNNTDDKPTEEDFEIIVDIF